MIQKFAQEKYFQAIEAILKTGVELKKYFSINNGDNPNELSMRLLSPKKILTLMTLCWGEYYQHNILFLKNQQFYIQYTIVGLLSGERDRLN